MAARACDRTALILLLRSC